MPTRHLECRPIQAQLGLVLPDPKEAKRTVYQYFDAYRTCRQLLGRDFVERAEMLTRQGYEGAMNPDDIRVPRVHGGAPSDWSGPTADWELLTEKEMEWMRFVLRMDRRVDGLPELQSLIIRVQFLDNDPPLQDESAFAIWEKQFAFSFSKFRVEKMRAVRKIAAGLNASA